MPSAQLDLFIPDRFDVLQRRAAHELESFVVPVDDAIERVRALEVEVQASRRGGFLILRGDSGSGKSTFLNTLGIFLKDVLVLAIRRERDIQEALSSAGPAKVTLRVIIIEGRDALRNVKEEDLEAAVHDINAFIRSFAGERTLVVWPVNTDDLNEKLIKTCKRVGADALLGVHEPSYRFLGPGREHYYDIANRTIATLNEGASLTDMGITEALARELTEEAPTIGAYLGMLRKELIRNQKVVTDLLKRERCRLWIVVSAANDPDGDIAGLTRGTASTADIERLMSATNANVVKDLKRFPEKLGILSAVLDGKILHLPAVTALSIAREFADDKLTAAMSHAGLSVVRKKDAVERLQACDLGNAFTETPMGTRRRGAKPGPNTVEAFKKLASVASNNDEWLNSAVGRALIACGLVRGFRAEQDLGGGLSRRTDILCESQAGIVRLELMWRTKTGRADIANYALTKLYNYGRAIGFLEG